MDETPGRRRTHHRPPQVRTSARTQPAQRRRRRCHQRHPQRCGHELPEAPGLLLALLSTPLGSAPARPSAVHSSFAPSLNGVFQDRLISPRVCILSLVNCSAYNLTAAPQIVLLSARESNRGLLQLPQSFAAIFNSLAIALRAARECGLTK